jgi:hypothetical protein
LAIDAALPNLPGFIYGVGYATGNEEDTPTDPDED